MMASGSPKYPATSGDVEEAEGCGKPSMPGAVADSTGANEEKKLKANASGTFAEQEQYVKEASPDLMAVLGGEELPSDSDDGDFEPGAEDMEDDDDISGSDDSYVSENGMLSPSDFKMSHSGQVYSESEEDSNSVPEESTIVETDSPATLNGETGDVDTGEAIEYDTENGKNRYSQPEGELEMRVGGPLAFNIYCKSREKDLMGGIANEKDLETFSKDWTAMDADQRRPFILKAHGKEELSVKDNTAQLSTDLGREMRTIESATNTHAHDQLSSLYTVVDNNNDSLNGPSRQSWGSAGPHLALPSLPVEIFTKEFQEHFKEEQAKMKKILIEEKKLLNLKAQATAKRDDVAKQLVATRDRKNILEQEAREFEKECERLVTAVLKAFEGIDIDGIQKPAANVKSVMKFLEDIKRRLSNNPTSNFTVALPPEKKLKLKHAAEISLPSK
eukprot:Nk52_evm23s1810 gene=Nk52_evmTU23s1810